MNRPNRRLAALRAMAAQSESPREREIAAEDKAATKPLETRIAGMKSKTATFAADMAND